VSENKLEIVPLKYRVDFNGKSLDAVISEKSVQEMINA
jgi:hypothetical protein